MGNISPAILTKCEDCGKVDLDLPCIQFPDGTYKVLCDECFNKRNPKKRNV